MLYNLLLVHYQIDVDLSITIQLTEGSLILMCIHDTIFALIYVLNIPSLVLRHLLLIIIWWSLIHMYQFIRIRQFDKKYSKTKIILLKGVITVSLMLFDERHMRLIKINKKMISV